MLQVYTKQAGHTGIYGLTSYFVSRDDNAEVDQSFNESW